MCMYIYIHSYKGTIKPNASVCCGESMALDTYSVCFLVHELVSLYLPIPKLYPTHSQNPIICANTYILHYVPTVSTYVHCITATGNNDGTQGKE